jgi:hypothetical protein
MYPTGRKEESRFKIYRVFVASEIMRRAARMSVCGIDQDKK